MNRFKLNQKGIIAQALILLVLTAGIAGGVYLVKHPQIFKPKAGGGAIFFRQVNGDPLPRTAEGIPQTTSPTFQVELNSTLGPPVFASPTPSSAPTRTTTPTPTAKPSPTLTPTPSPATYTWKGTNLNATTICSNPDVTKFNVSLTGDVAAQTAGKGIWVTLTGDGKTIVTSFQPGDSTHISANYTNGEVGSIRGEGSITLRTSGPTTTYGYKFKAYSAPTTDGIPNFIGAPVLGEVDFATDCNKVLFKPTPTASPAGVGTTGRVLAAAASAQISGTVSYKIAENSTDLAKAAEIPYPTDSVIFNYTLSPNNQTPGVKTIWVEFKDVTGRTDRVSAQIEMVSSLLSPTPSNVGVGTSGSQTSYQRVFVTSTTYSGNLGGLVGADAKCQARANAANLGGTWRAWLSDRNIAAASRLNKASIPYKLLDGTQIAKDWNDLIDGNLSHQINVTENKTTISSGGTWTSTSTKGEIAEQITVWVLFPSSIPDCRAWSVGSVENHYGVVGSTSYTNQAWTNSGMVGCNEQMALYCFEVNEPIPSPTPVPSITGFGKAIKITSKNSTLRFTGSELNPQTFTIEGWFKAEGSSTNAILFNKRYNNSGAKSPDYRESYSLVASGDGLQAILFTNPQSTVTTKTNPLTDKKWHHIAFVRQQNPPKDTNCLRIYVDGKLDGSYRFGCGLVYYEGGDLYIGSRLVGCPSIYGCEFVSSEDLVIDEVRLSSVVRYSSDFTRPTVPFTSDSNTVALWHFDGNIEDTTSNMADGAAGSNIGTYVDSTIKGVPTPTFTATPTPSPTPTPTPVPPTSGGGGSSGGGGGGGGSRPTPSPQRIIKEFRYAENPNDIETLSWQPYVSGIVADHTFSDPSPGLKFIFIQFRDNNGDLVLINGQRYITSSIELISEQPTPIPTPAAPTSNIPAPLASDSPNCPIENPSNYDIGTLYKMCSVNQLARFDLKWLVDFPNEILIDIGRRKGDLGGFLANFSGERLIGAPPYSGSGFSLEILRELPEWRKKQLPGYIQDQLK